MSTFDLHGKRAELKTIDIARDFKRCQHFRKISYQASYGHLDGFEKDYGDSYFARLSHKIEQAPALCCHLWVQDQIIAQTEGKFIRQADIGYINLLSVLPEWQQQGIGRQLLLYLAGECRRQGCSHLQLSVSPTNSNALGFYLNQGWSNLGRRDQQTDMLRLMRAL